MTATLIQFKVKDATTARRTILHRILYGYRSVRGGVEYKAAGIIASIPNVTLAPHLHIVRKHYVARLIRRLEKFDWVSVTRREVEPTAEDCRLLGAVSTEAVEVST